MRRLILGMVTMSAALNTAMGGPLEDAQAAYSRGDRATTLRFIRALADQDVNGVQSLLGKIFPPCKGDIPDYSEIVTLFRRDADRGNPRAQFNLGNAYFFGNGVPRDHVQAVKWFRLAADQGEAGALHNLGFMYEKGKGVPQDNVRAYMWLSLSSSRPASTDNKDAAARSLGILAARMTPAQLAEAQGLAREWTPVRQRDE